MRTRYDRGGTAFAYCCLLVAFLVASPASATIDSDRSFVLSVDSVPPARGGAIDFTIDDGTAETSIGDSGQFIWLNRFTPDPADYPLQIEQVQVLLGTTMVTVGDPIQIVFFSDTDGDGDPGTGAVFLGEYTSTVQFSDGATFNVYDLPVPMEFDGPGDVIIGAINRVGSEGFNDFPAALDQTATAGRSWAATYLAGDVPAAPFLPADEQWGTIDSFGFPGNWMIRASGSPISRPPPPPPTPVPVNSWLGLVLITLLLGFFGWQRQRRMQV